MNHPLVKHSGWGGAPESMSDFDLNTILLYKSVLDNFCSPAVQMLIQNSTIELLHTWYIYTDTGSASLYRCSTVNTGQSHQIVKVQLHSVTCPCCVEWQVDWLLFLWYNTWNQVQVWHCSWWAVYIGGKHTVNGSQGLDHTRNKTQVKFP